MPPLHCGWTDLLEYLHQKEETFSRHSLLGPNGLRGQWQAPISGTRVQYPSHGDLTPIEMPMLCSELLCTESSKYGYY